MKFKNLTIATTAFEPSEDVRESADRIIKQVTQLKKDNPQIDLIVFCELSLNKFVNLLDDGEYLSKCVINLSGEIVSSLKKCGKDNSVNLSIGITEEKDGEYYNSQLLINRQGEIVSVHRKTKLTAEEDKIFKKGNGTITFCELEGITIGTTLCYDLLEHKQLKKTQPHLLIHALTDPGEPRFATGFSGRANKGFYVSANRFGVENTKKYSGNYNGHISVVGPMGKILELKYGQPNVIIREIKIRLHPSWALMLIRGISNAVLIALNFIRYFGKVIDYLKWHFKMIREKKNNKKAK